MTAAAASFYVTGGTLRQDAPSYVERQADADLYEGLSRGEFCYVLTSRQMGKSSLMVRTAARLREDGTAVAVLDLTRIGQNLTVEQWYEGLLDHLGRYLDLEDELEAFWEEHAGLGPLQRWMTALRDVVLRKRKSQIVIFLDEIDAVRSLPFSADEFFAAIRECYTRRAEDPEYNRLAFCLLGVATPSDLIQDTRTTPFNIGRRIELTDFSKAEVLPLAFGLGGDTQSGKELLDRVLFWTGGHPYLTQRLCQAIAGEQAAHPKSEFRDPKSAVDRHCEALFLSAAARERDDNLTFVRERLLKSEADLASLLELYGRVRAGKPVRPDDTNPLLDLLRLSGVARLVGHCMVVRNRIYERVFDRAWVRQHMPDAELRRQKAAFRRGVLRTGAIATVIVTAMGVSTFEAVRSRSQANVLADQRQAALIQANRAGLHERKVRLKDERLLYDADMNVAQQTWAAGNAGRMVELLEAHRLQPGEEDLRGFEWFYLWRLGHGDRLTLPGRPPLFGPVAFSPNGKMLAVGGTPSGVHLWDTSTGRELRTLTDHNNIRQDVDLRFSSDGKMLTTVSQDGTVRFWDLQAARAPRSMPFKVVSDPVSGLLSPDSRMLAVHDRLDRIVLRDLTTGRVLRTFPTGPITSYAFSPDGKTLAAGRFGDPISLWDVKTGRKTGVFQYPGTNVVSLALSPDGRRLAAGNFDGVLTIWDVPSGKELHKLQASRVVIQGLAFSPDGRLLATASRDSTAKLRDVESGLEVQTFRGHGGEVFSVAFSPDGRRLATASFDGTAKVWDVVETPQGSTPPWERERAGSLAFAPDGRTLATWGGRGSGSDTQVRLWSLPAGHGTPTLKGHVEGHDPLAFSPDGKLLATVSRRTVRLWDLATGRETQTLAGQMGDTVAVAFSPAGRTLATASQDTTVRLWNVATGRQIWTRSKFLDGIHSAAFSPDGRTLAVAGWTDPHRGGFTQLLAADTGRLVRTLKGHSVSVSSVAYSPDGRLLAAASWDSTATLWDPATGQLLRTLPNPFLLTSVAFSPDGRRLATGDGDGAVKLWDPTSGREILTLHELTGDTRVAFSPDGRRLAACDLKAKVKLWEAASKEEVASREAREHPSTVPTAR